MTNLWTVGPVETEQADRGHIDYVGDLVSGRGLMSFSETLREMTRSHDRALASGFGYTGFHKSSVIDLTLWREATNDD